MMAAAQCIAVYGAGGLGREVAALVRAQYGAISQVILVDDNIADGVTILSFEAFMELPAPIKRVTLAVADPAARRQLADRCAGAGLEPVEVRAGNATVFDDAVVGEGAILAPFSLVSTNVRIGRQFQANYYAYVAHDCVIGDFVTLAPGAQCNGNVHIGDHAYIGAGAIIKQGTGERPLRIGYGAVVGMGAVVLADVSPEQTMVGNPARVLRG